MSAVGVVGVDVDVDRNGLSLLRTSFSLSSSLGGVVADEGADKGADVDAAAAAAAAADAAADLARSFGPWAIRRVARMVLSSLVAEQGLAGSVSQSAAIASLFENE